MNKTNPLWHGVVLVAGGAVGAGMFALPMVAAGMWFSWACVGLLVTWAFTYVAAKTLLEVNLTFAPGTSFHSMVRDVLGTPMAWLNNVAIGFIMMILMYAYITAGAGILQHSLSSVIDLNATAPRALLSLTFAVLVGIFVWLGTTMVSRVSTILMVGLVITFIVTNAEMLTHVDWLRLSPNTTDVEYLKFSWSALPVFVTAFACAGLVPSLVKHYSTSPEKAKRSLLLGTLVVLLVYILWLATTFGSLPRVEYLKVIDQGGKIEHLVGALQESSQNGESANHDSSQASTLTGSLKWFSNFAILTSFLSIGLGLYHFLIDGLKLGSHKAGRAKAAMLTFLPPAVFSVLLPFGFVKLIGFAGLLVAFSFFIVPAMMHINRNGPNSPAIATFVFGCVVALLKGSLMLGLLPTYGP